MTLDHLVVLLGSEFRRGEEEANEQERERDEEVLSHEGWIGQAFHDP
jgi:hypothetical protein